MPNCRCDACTEAAADVDLGPFALIDDFFRAVERNRQLRVGIRYALDAARRGNTNLAAAILTDLLDVQ